MDKHNQETLDAIQGLLSELNRETDSAVQQSDVDLVSEFITELDDKEAFVIATNSLYDVLKARHHSSIPLDESEESKAKPELTEEQKIQNGLENSFSYWSRQQNLANLEGNRNGAINQAHEAQTRFIRILEGVETYEGKDTFIRQLFSGLDDHKQTEFVPFINGVVNEIVLKEELEIISSSVEIDNPGTAVTVRKATREEDINQGFDFKVRVVDEKESRDIEFDAKSRSQFIRMQNNQTIQSSADMDSRYMGKKGSGVIVVSPEARGGSESILMDNEVSTPAMLRQGEHKYVPSFKRNTANVDAFRAALQAQITSQDRQPELV